METPVSLTTATLHALVECSNALGFEVVIGMQLRIACLRQLLQYPGVIVLAHQLIAVNKSQLLIAPKGRLLLGQLRGS